MTTECLLNADTVNQVMVKWKCAHAFVLYWTNVNGQNIQALGRSQNLLKITITHEWTRKKKKGTKLYSMNSHRPPCMGVSKTTVFIIQKYYAFDDDSENERACTVENRPSGLHSSLAVSVSMRDAKRGSTLCNCLLSAATACRLRAREANHISSC